MRNMARQVGAQGEVMMLAGIVGELWILGCFNPQLLNPGWWFGT